MNNELSRMPGSFNKKYNPRNDLQTINKDVKDSYSDTLVLLIGQSNGLMSIKKELEANDVTVVSVDELTEEIVMKHVLEISAIITCFNYIETTMTMIKENIILKHLFIPVIVYSDLNNSFSRKVSYLHGVDEYIPSSIDINEIIIRVNKQIEKKKMLDSFVFLDELTKAYNRKYLISIYSQFTYLNKPFTFVLMDIDCFEQINDKYGYIVGDEVLKALVNEIKKSLSEASVVVRLGGDEFLILSTSISTKLLHKKVNNIFKHFSNINFHHNNGTFKCTFSAGILKVNPKDVDLNKAISQAQSLLRFAKKDNENFVCIKEELD